MARPQWSILCALALVLAQCSEKNTAPDILPEGSSPMFDSAVYAAVSARLRDAFVLHDTAFCDSVLPWFDDPALARIHPDRVVDGFVSNLIGHDAPQPATKKRFDELVTHSGASVMRNWRDYLEARALQNAGARQQAIALFEPLLAHFEHDRDTVGIASVSKRIGNLYLELGDPTTAVAHLLRARSLEPRVDLRGTITATLGRCYALLVAIDSVRWCAARLNEYATDAQSTRRNDDRASVNATWLLHLAALAQPAKDSVLGALRQVAAVDSMIKRNNADDGFLVAAEPAARMETLVLRAKALLRLNMPRETLRTLVPVAQELERCPDCLSQRLEYLSAQAEALARIGDLHAALHVQEERAEVLAQNEVGRERLAVEKARAKALSIQQEAAAEQRLEKQMALSHEQDREHRMQRINLVVMIGFIILFAGVLFVRLRTKRRMQLEEVRTRLSRDLHDDIGSTLSSINILTTVARKKAEAGDVEGATASLTGISERSQRLQRNMSDIVWSVDPARDTLEELLARMREFGASVLEPKGILFRFDSRGDFATALPPMVKSNLYLIFKEAVNNAAKHAQATKVIVAVDSRNDRLHLTIADNGQGLPDATGTASTPGGNGLRNMRMRAAEMKAELLVKGTPHNGTTIELVAPF